MTELPKLTGKQQQFVLYYNINGGNATEAYKKSYNCEGMKDTSINVEASKLLKNPNVSLWIKQAEKNIQQVFEDEIKYSAKDCFDELQFHMTVKYIFDCLFSTLYSYDIEKAKQISKIHTAIFFDKM